MNTMTMSNDENVMDMPESKQSVSSVHDVKSGTSQQEYTNEQVTEIIRVALKAGTDGGDTTVSHAEMLAIGEEFGLSSEDLQRASEVIASSQDGVGRAKRAMMGVKINFICYLAGVLGVFLINAWTNSVSGDVVWWFFLAAAAYGPVVAVHAFFAKFHPELTFSMLHDDGSDEDGEED